MSIKDNAKNSDTWLRGLFILVFGVIFYFLYGLIWLLVIFQFITKVTTGNLNSNLEEFSKKLTAYATQILNYITYQSEERPFPFSPFEGEESKTPATPKTKKKTSKKTASKKKTAAKNPKDDESKPES